MHCDEGLKKLSHFHSDLRANYIFAEFSPMRIVSVTSNNLGTAKYIPLTVLYCQSAAGFGYSFSGEPAVAIKAYFPWKPDINICR